LDWTETRVGHFEAGRSIPTFATVLAVTLTLQRALDDIRKRGATPTIDDIRLVDLIRLRGGFIALNSDFDVAVDALEEV
jgi:hypothetical protein